MKGDIIVICFFCVSRIGSRAMTAGETRHFPCTGAGTSPGTGAGASPGTGVECSICRLFGHMRHRRLLGC